VAGPGDLEPDTVLPLEQDLPVIDPPGRLHDAEGANQRFTIQTVIAQSRSICA
jgi:hypothetical protein